jgi:chitinase
VLNYINKNGYTRYWDSVSKVPYLFNPETKVFISYDDQESICYKAQYANEKGLGGGMVWEVTSDYNKELQQLSYDVMVGGATHCTF